MLHLYTCRTIKNLAIHFSVKPRTCEYAEFDGNYGFADQ